AIRHPSRPRPTERESRNGRTSCPQRRSWLPFLESGFRLIQLLYPLHNLLCKDKAGGARRCSALHRHVRPRRQLDQEHQSPANSRSAPPNLATAPRRSVTSAASPNVPVARHASLRMKEDIGVVRIRL